MSHTRTRMTFAQIPTDWASLVGLYPLSPIRDNVVYDNVCEIIDAMAGRDLNKDQGDFLESLSILIEAYDREHNQICTSRMSPIEALKFLLEENHMTASDLGRLLGHRTLGSPILRGRRNLTLRHIKILAERFKVSASLFL
jgi:HTH-type transcriptional regulator/antitoxin HigA